MQEKILTNRKKTPYLCNVYSKDENGIWQPSKHEASFHRSNIKNAYYMNFTADLQLGMFFGPFTRPKEPKALLIREPVL